MPHAAEGMPHAAEGMPQAASREGRPLDNLAAEADMGEGIRLAPAMPSNRPS